MIITCPNCNKQFKINNSMIPDEGRDLQCGSCNHIWFYKIEEKSNETSKLNDEIINKDIEIKAKPPVSENKIGIVLFLMPFIFCKSFACERRVLAFSKPNFSIVSDQR